MKQLFVLCISLILLVLACKNNADIQNDFKLSLVNPKPAYNANEPLMVVLESNSNRKADSLVYFIDGKRLGTARVKDTFTVSLQGSPLGLRKIYAEIYADKKQFIAAVDVLHLATEAPKLYTYKVVNQYPHDINAYTQGLEFVGDTLYESTGQYGKSSLRKTDYQTGEIWKQVNLDRAYFGEGITVFNNKIYQLTWQEKTGFIYNPHSLEKTGTFVYDKSEEGWGLCNDGRQIYKSDGTHRIWKLHPDNLTEVSFVEVYTNTSRIKSVNELEWVEGKILANIFQQNAIAIINPGSGAVEGVIDLNGLQQQVTQHPDLDVLNGIAYKGEPNRLFVTGKNWDKLFEIEYFEKQ